MSECVSVCACVLTGSMPVAMAAAADFEKLTRRHAIKLIPSVACSVAEAALAVGEVVGCDAVKSASRMNGAIVMFLDSTAKVSEVVEKGVVIHDTFNPVLPLVNPATRVMISNAPPFIKNDTLIMELSRYGQIVSQIKMVSLGSKSPKLRHVVSHRRQVFMVLKDNTRDLNLSFSFKVEGFNYMVFVSSETMKCFECGEEGHLVRSCPGKGGAQRPAAAAAAPAPTAAAAAAAPAEAAEAATAPAATGGELPRAAQAEAAAGGAPPAEPPAPLVEGTEVAQVASEAPESPLPEVGVQGEDPPVNTVSEQTDRQTDSQSQRKQRKKQNRSMKKRNETAP